MSEFVCRSCVSSLDKLTRVQFDCEKVRTGIVSTLMETSLRHMSALRWEAEGHAGAGNGECVATIPSVSMPSPSRIPVAKRILPTILLQPRGPFQSV